MTTRTTKIVFEFPTALTASQWFDELAREGFTPTGTDAYRADALDISRGGDAGTYIVRRTDEGRTHTLRGDL